MTKKWHCLAIVAAMIWFFSESNVYAQQVGGGDLTFAPRNVLPVVFSHKKHVSGKGLACTDCHYQFFQMAQGSYKMDMAKMTKSEFCGRCHDGKMTFDVKAPQNCSRCHR
jgi:c(7)-type cytochrome triheme protein